MVYCEAPNCRAATNSLTVCGVCKLLVCDRCWNASHKKHR